MTPTLVTLCLASMISAGTGVLSPASAQQTEAALVRHLDSIMPLLEEARAATALARAERLEARRAQPEALGPFEKVVVGPLTVYAMPGEAPTVQDVVGDVWYMEYAPWLAGAIEPGAIGFVFHWGTLKDPKSLRGLGMTVVHGGPLESRTVVEDGVRYAIGLSLKNLIGDSGMGNWELTPIGPQDGAMVYRRVATTPSAAVRSCLTGSSNGCLEAMGLRTDGTPLDEWYTPAERRLLVLRSGERFGDETSSELPECRAGSLSACDRVLRRYENRAAWATPLGPEAHTSLAWIALNVGGAGAWQRFLDHLDEGPLPALEAASALDADALVLAWRSWLVSARPNAQAGPSQNFLGSLFWIILLSTLAVRSTRWRFN